MYPGSISPALRLEGPQQNAGTTSLQLSDFRQGGAAQLVACAGGPHILSLCSQEEHLRDCVAYS